MVIREDISDEQARELIEAELVRLAGGDAQKLWKLRKFQATIDRELKHYTNPIARMNKMVELFWKGVKDFHEVIK